MIGMSKNEINHIYQKCNGIIHVGANIGQEAPKYAALKKSVIWIEAEPSIYKTLNSRIAKYNNQQCINALITNKNNQEYIFRIASNKGGSSSIFEFDEYVKCLYPNLNLETKQISLSSKTLDTVLHENGINAEFYDFLLLDIQGAELLALMGAENYLNNNCKYIYTEVSTKQIYKNAVLYSELKQYLNSKNFFETSEPKLEHTNILFIKA